jgi:hypothetical protein
MKAAGDLSQCIRLLSNKSIGMTTVIDAINYSEAATPCTRMYQHPVDLNASTLALQGWTIL